MWCYSNHAPQQVETFSTSLALWPVDSPPKGLVTRNFDVFFDKPQNKRLSKQARRRWFETLSRSLWRHCNVLTQWGRLMHTFVSALVHHSIHYNDVIMSLIASQITSLTVVYSAVYSDADKKKHQSSVWLAFVWGIHRDRWIPRTKGQLRGKCFHLMTSSCIRHFPVWLLNSILCWALVSILVLAPHSDTPLS